MSIVCKLCVRCHLELVPLLLPPSPLLPPQLPLQPPLLALLLSLSLLRSLLPLPSLSTLPLPVPGHVHGSFPPPRYRPHELHSISAT